MKKVSIIIPVYNMENCVSEGVGCITCQTYENMEIIIIDDGSKDGTYLKCLAEADKDRRIAVFSKNNEGHAAARNLALRKATGEYVYFFDMDDYIEPNAIERLVGAIESSESDLAVCSFSMYDGKRIIRTIKKIDAVYDASSARQNYAEHLSMYGEKGIQGAPWYKLYKMDIIRENKIEFPPLRKSEDDVFITRYVNCIERFCIISDVLCRYTVNSYKRFWEKYPFDIFETARKSTMYVYEVAGKWNSADIPARNGIFNEYFRKTFGSLCFLFNPKLGLTSKQRIARIKEISDIFISDIPQDFYVGHKVFDCMKKQKYKTIYVMILLHIIRHYFD
ncbi:MAG: glycosyltransferase family 2 protein [Clostridia bacterium]|nr:glycosyltransferase family 2 protein [Clostridia bacterium]